MNTPVSLQSLYSITDHPQWMEYKRNCNHMDHSEQFYRWLLSHLWMTNVVAVPFVLKLLWMVSHEVQALQAHWVFIFEAHLSGTAQQEYKHNWWHWSVVTNLLDKTTKWKRYQLLDVDKQLIFPFLLMVIYIIRLHVLTQMDRIRIYSVACWQWWSNKAVRGAGLYKASQSLKATLLWWTYMPYSVSEL